MTIMLFNKPQATGCEDEGEAAKNQQDNTGVAAVEVPSVDGEGENRTDDDETKTERGKYNVHVRRSQLAC